MDIFPVAIIRYGVAKSFLAFIAFKHPLFMDCAHMSRKMVFPEIKPANGTFYSHLINIEHIDVGL